MAKTGTHRMQFADGTHLDTDMIVFSAGIRPRDEIARDCGLELGARGGIVIDDALPHERPDIYAIGECALWNGRCSGSSRRAMTWRASLRSSCSATQAGFAAPT